MSNWLSKNKVILAILFLFVAGNFFFKFLHANFNYQGIRNFSNPNAISQGIPSMGKDVRDSINSESMFLPPEQEYTPIADADERMVIKSSDMSLKVKDPKTTAQRISDYALSNGGYMVNTHFSSPDGETTYAAITIRVPVMSLGKTLEFLRTQAEIVVSEFLSGQDITDQYVDIQSRLETLSNTKLKFENLLEKTEKIDEILRIQREIINLQTQIDNLKGRQDYLEKSAELATISINLSTDELALPYDSAGNFRPKVIFKLAVRSLTSNLRNITSALIWLAVYSVVIIPLFLLLYLVYKRIKRV